MEVTCFMSEGEKPARAAIASLTLQGAVAMAVAYAAQKAHVTLPEGAVAHISEALTQLLFYGGLLAVGVGRARARGPII
jgi:hypothetical protein